MLVVDIRGRHRDMTHLHRFGRVGMVDGQIFVNGFRNHFNGIQILSEETEPEKADTKVDSMDLPPGLKVRTHTTFSGGEDT